MGIRNFFEGAYQQTNDRCGQFHCNGFAFEIAAHTSDGPGCLILESQDIGVTLEAPPENGQNSLQGTITDMERVRLGIELSIDIGTTLYALVNESQVAALDLRIGSRVWASFPANAPHFSRD